MIRTPIFLLASLLSCFPADGHARTFTSNDGETLQAEIVAATETTVTLARESDQRRFELPLARLSESDAAHVAAWRTHLEHPLGWRRLRIHGDGQTIVASCLPIYGSIEGTRTWASESNATLELTLPVGAWVHVGLRPEGARIEGLVEYKGASDWYLSSRDDTLSIRTSPNGKASPGVVQVALDRLEKSIAQVQGTALRAGASLTTQLLAGNKTPLPRINYQAANLHLTGPPAWSELPPSLRALQLHTAGVLDLAGLERFADLEHLSVSASSITGLKHLSSHSKLRAIHLRATFFDADELGHLGSLAQLRHLYLHANQRSSAGDRLYSFLGSLNQLESLALIQSDKPASIEAALLKNCTRLTRTDFAPRGTGSDGVWSDYPFLTDLSLAQLGSKVALELMQSGHLKHIHTVREAQFRDPLINVPKLRNLQLGGRSWPQDAPRWNELPFLERVDLNCPTREALIRICSHPAFRTLHHLILQTNGSEIDPLVQLPNLRSLRLDAHSGAGSFDLAPFPNLQNLELLRSRYLDISNLQNLQALRLEGPNIDRLGNGSPTKLRALEVTGSKLKNLDGIEDSPDLRSLCLHECSRLASLSKLADRLSRDQVHISQCPRLNSEATH